MNVGKKYQGHKKLRAQIKILVPDNGKNTLSI